MNNPHSIQNPENPILTIDDRTYIFINELYNNSYDRYFVSVRLNWRYRRIPRAHWVYMSTVNKIVPKGKCIHHIDKNRHNDVIENLTCITIAEHNLVHHDDANRYYFHTWSKLWAWVPKSPEHRAKLSVIQQAKQTVIRENVFKIGKKHLTLTMTEKEFLPFINRKSHSSVKRITWMNFTTFKKFILTNK